MCGFVGYVNQTENTTENEKIIKAMADRIVHRGPDQDDYYVDGDVSLGFRRLSIIDLDGGSQPILNEDGTKVLIFNGEIYNYQPLREELLAAGHSFKTETDSEVLLHGYEQWGKNFAPPFARNVRVCDLGQTGEKTVRRTRYFRYQTVFLLFERGQFPVRFRN